MDRDVYLRMQEIEAEHWWFVARRKIIATVLERHIRPGPEAQILEAGCGTGGNLSLLQGFGALDAFEYDEFARNMAQASSGLTIPFGALPNEIPFGDKHYDVIALFDVLEHIELDRAALEALSGRLSPQGAIFLTVPAFQALWSRHDEAHHHFRRYTKSTLLSVAQQAGLKVEFQFYFNSLLFPVALGLRGAKALTGSEAPDDALPGPMLNRALQAVFATERHLVGRLPMPVGLSLGAVLRREEA
ncbi:class I SAM-dependent methyltransferase [Aliiroseovarius crassostreae]|uniref:class I SAM-dependent methyltransferase n=1 Tax=Aliiroseovarius crassostreae TaxID=154981 RepID=UPI002208D8AB|nr:class I SAM-dependent methyltransferase [Aliiroseovarius crassostreae]UWQ11765.1 class I SAM-dependent methyltransferase [Aliiroseovarius crassostreae]